MWSLRHYAHKATKEIYQASNSELVQIYLIFQLVAGQKFCIVTEVGVSRSCRNDEAHKSASLDECPVDTLEVNVSDQPEMYSVLIFL